MPLGYTTPGVQVTEVTTPSLAPNITTPSYLCLIGTACGKQAATDKITLPASTTTVGIQVLPVTTLSVVSTDGFAATGTITVGSQSVAYTGKTATSFTGCSGGTGSQASGTTVSVDVAVTLVNTGVDTTSVVVRKASDLSTINPGNYTVAQSLDPNTTVTGDEIYTITRVNSPTAAPTAASGAGGNPSGTYLYAYSWVTAAGETGISPDSTPLVLSAQHGTVTLPANTSGPTGTTGKNVYRKRTSTGGDGFYHFIGTSATTSFDDNVLNAAAEVSGQPLGQTGALPTSGLSIGDVILASYNFTDQNYYQPTLFETYGDVIAKYGEPFAADGTISSQLTYATRLAFDNGAPEVICLAAKSTSSSDFSTAIDTLKNEQHIGIIVPVSGDANIHALLVVHTQYMQSQGRFRIGIIGQDSSAAAIAASTLRTAAKGINAEQIIHVAPASYQITNPITGRATAIGSQYMAAAIGGRFAGQDPQFPLTRRVIAGFIKSNEKRLESDKVLDSASGLLEIEEKTPGILRVMQSVTTSTVSINTREASVVRAKYEMIRRLRDGIDPIIGTAAAPSEMPLIVSGRVTSILDDLQQREIIAGYSGVAARALANDPTTVEVRFQYIPIYPLNNISVVFSIDTTSGIFSVIQ